MEVKVTVGDDYDIVLAQLRDHLAQVFYDRLILNIKSNKFGFKNSLRTIARKNGGVPMIDKGAYIKSIYVNGNKVEILSGNEPSGISFEELANVLEFGRRDKGFMGFPVWRKTLEQMQADMPQIIKQFGKKTNYG